MSRKVEWYEHDPAWTELANHCKCCMEPSCKCKLLMRNFGSWALKLPAQQGVTNAAPGGTWLWFKFTKCKQLRWTCLICGDTFGPSLDPPDVQHFTFGGTLMKHHGSGGHLRNAATMGFGDSSGDSKVPSADMFKELLAAFQKGGAPSAGFVLPSGKIGRIKAEKMLWCLHQANGDTKRRHLHSAEVLLMSRDERHGRLHIRIICASEDYIETFRAYLGQARNYNPDALGITQATVDVCREACTSRAHCPTQSAVPPYFDEKLFGRMRHAAEGIAIDSAESEVVSARDMARAKIDGSEADFPNCIHILRDAAHSARRTLQRLFAADKVLDYTMQFFFLLANMVQWSDDLRRLYFECTEKSDDAMVSTSFSHMRAAKHRIESWLTPLSRCCLDPEGHLMSAVHATFFLKIYNNPPRAK